MDARAGGELWNPAMSGEDPADPAPEDEGYGIAPDGAPTYELAPDEAPRAIVACGACGAPMLERHTVCGRCGMDRKAGAATSSLSQHTRERGRRVLKCGNCGYDMAGVPSLVCPECGERADTSFHRRTRRQASRDATLGMWLKPGLMFVIGAGIMVLVKLIFATPADALQYLAQFAVTVPVGIAVLFACSLIWIGFDQPFHVQALGLAGVYAVYDVLLLVLGAVLPNFMWIVALVLAFVAMVALLADVLDLEIPDAIILALLTNAVWLVVALAAF